MRRQSVLIHFTMREITNVKFLFFLFLLSKIWILSVCPPARSLSRSVYHCLVSFALHLQPVMVMIFTSIDLFRLMFHTLLVTQLLYCLPFSCYRWLKQYTMNNLCVSNTYYTFTVPIASYCIVFVAVVVVIEVLFFSSDQFWLFYYICFFFCSASCCSSVYECAM